MFSSERINKLFIKACTDGDLPLVTSLYKDLYLRPNSILGKFSSFLFLSNYPYGTLNPHAYRNHAFLDTCYRGNNDVLCFLLENKKFVKNISETDALSEGFSISLKIGNVKMADLLLYFIKNNQKNYINFLDYLTEGFSHSCENGKTNSVNYVLSNLSSIILKLRVNSSEHGVSLATYGFVKACSFGQTKVLNCFANNSFILNNCNVMLGLSAAIENGHIDAIKYMFTNNFLNKYIKLENIPTTTVSSLEMMHYLMYDLNLKDNKQVMNKFKYDFPLHLAEKIQVKNELNNELLIKENNNDVKNKKKLKV